jgi:hypothetical protein
MITVAEARTDPAELINAAVDASVRHQFELPSLDALGRLAASVHAKVNAAQGSALAIPSARSSALPSRHCFGRIPRPRNRPSPRSVVPRVGAQYPRRDCEHRALDAVVAALRAPRAAACRRRFALISRNCAIRVHVILHHACRNSTGERPKRPFEPVAAFGKASYGLKGKTRRYRCVFGHAATH